jgi:hypothetical protein
VPDIAADFLVVVQIAVWKMVGRDCLVGDVGLEPTTR